MGFFTKMLKKLGGEGRVEKKRAFFRSQKMKDYHRLHSWIESRIGPLTKQEDPQQLHPRLLKLMEEEEYVWGIHAIGGLEGYIETYAYRKLLGT